MLAKGKREERKETKETTGRYYMDGGRRPTSEAQDGPSLDHGMDHPASSPALVRTLVRDGEDHLDKGSLSLASQAHQYKPISLEHMFPSPKWHPLQRKRQYCMLGG
jgi:hypothetical protein